MLGRNRHDLEVAVARPRVCTHHDEARKFCGRRATPTSHPPRCIFHAEAIQPKEILDEILQQKAVKAAVGRLGEIVDHALSARIAGVIDRIGNVVGQVAASGRLPNDAPPPPRQAPRQASRQAPPQEDPRVVLGFPTNAKLTAQAVKERHRQLAMLMHSDQGGNDESMRRLNLARDNLLKGLR